MRPEALRAVNVHKIASNQIAPRLMKILFVSLVALAGMLSTVEAATYYVAITGSDSNLGSQSSPFRTVKKGISILKPGDKLYIRGGNYGESIESASQIVPSGTSWSSPITIAAYPGEVVTLRSIGLWHPSIRYLIFDGFVLDAQGLNEGIYLSDGANHIRFRNCEVKGARRTRCPSHVQNRGDEFQRVHKPEGPSQRHDLQPGSRILYFNKLQPCPELRGICERRLWNTRIQRIHWPASRRQCSQRQPSS